MEILASKLKLPEKMVKFYTYVEEMEDLKLGRYIRWIHTENLKKISNGGFLIKIGEVCTCKNAKGMLFSVAVEDNLIFQRMSNDEIIIKYASRIAE